MRKLFKYLVMGVGLLYLQAILSFFDKKSEIGMQSHDSSCEPFPE